MVKFLSRLLMKLAAQRQLGTRQSRRPTRRTDAHLAADVALCAPSSTRRQAAAFSSFERLETRTLLVSTLNGLADGRLIYSGTAVANNLTIGFDGTNYSLNDTGETITLLGTVAGIGAGSGTNTVTFNPASLAAFTTFVINNGVGNDTITVTGFRGGQEGLDIQDAAAQGTDTINLNTDLGAAGSRLTRPAQLLSETVNLGSAGVGGSVFTNNQTITLGAASAAVNLAANVTADAGTGTVSSSSTINGGNSLTVTAGSVQLTGTIGGVTPLTDLTLTATGAGAMQVPAATVTGDISITAGAGGTNLRGNLTAGDDITITSAATNVTVAPIALVTGGTVGNDINVSGSINGTQSLQLQVGTGPAAGSIVVGGNIGLTGAASLLAEATSIDFNGTTSAAGGITLDAPTIFARALSSSGGSIFVIGNITFDGAGAVTNTAGTASTLSFTGNVTGNGSDLNLRGANTVTVTGAITTVATLSIAKGGVGTIADATVNNVTVNNIAITATNIHTQGDLTATAQAIALTGAVVLDGTVDPTITIQSGLGVGDSITITGTINDAGNPTALELIAGNDTNVNLDGAVTVTGAIGGTTPIPSLIAAGATVNLQAVDVTTGNITLGGGTLNLGGNLSGSGGANNVIFLPNGTGGTLEIHNIATAPPSNNMTVDTTDLSRLTASIEKMIFGGNSTGVVTLFNTVPGVINMPRNSEFRGATVNLNEIINQGANSVELFTDTLNIAQPINGTGAVSLDALNVGGTLTVNGNFAQSGWGASAVTVNNVGGTVTMNGHFGGLNVASITVNAGTLNGTAQPSAIEANGNVTLNVTTLNETGGVHSSTGSVLITGNVVSTTGPLTFLIPAGQNLQINGTVTAAGNVVIRGRGGALAAASLLGNVTTTGALQIDSSGANTAALVNLVGAVQASSITVRGTQINLVNNLTATGGNVQLAGAVDLFNNVVMTSSGLGTHFVRVDGTINGNFNLESQSGLGRTFFVGVIGGVTPLANLTVRSGGANQVTHNITVTGTVDWLSGDTAASDSISVLTGRTITAGVAIILEADTVVVNQLTQLFAPSVTVISNGAP